MANRLLDGRYWHWRCLTSGRVVWPKEGHPTSHSGAARYQPQRPAEISRRPAILAKDLQRGPVNVAPLPPGLPGEHYKPVVVPNGAALPFKVVGGSRSFI